MLAKARTGYPVRAFFFVPSMAVNPAQTGGSLFAEQAGADSEGVANGRVCSGAGCWSGHKKGGGCFKHSPPFCLTLSGQHCLGTAEALGEMTSPACSWPLLRCCQ
ncbi:MAG: hypothetical protein PF442_08295 [Desulfobulbaceae bacterium]|nr:hypothetical protein [Desulfobulbaceae bacterium]